METFLKDLRYGLRILARSPGVTAVAVLALALGIGANTAVFSVVNAVLLRPLPYHRDAARLVQIWGSNPSRNIPFHNVTYADALDYKQESRSFESFSAAGLGSANLLAGNEPERVELCRVNAEFFPMIGVPFAHGRGFLPEEDRPGAPRVAVLSYALWQRRFGSDPKIAGKPVVFDTDSYSVVGVLPPGFEWQGRVIDAFVPLALPSVFDQRNRSVSVSVFARLKPGVTIAQAQSELTGIGRRIGERWVNSSGRHPRVWGLRDFVVREVKPGLVVLAWAMALVLLIACANVANLLLARAGARQREMAVRLAMGASEGRLMRQLLTESGMLAMAGGALGVAIAYWGLHGLVALSPAGYPFLKDARVDLPVLGFTLAVSMATGILFGLAPAFAARHTGSLGSALKEGSRGSGESIARNRVRSALVVGEVALALMLLIGAGLLMASFVRLYNVPPGFQTRDVLTASVSLPHARYLRPEQRVIFFRDLMQKLGAAPGMRVAGAVSALPLTRYNTGTVFLAEGRPFPPRGEEPIIWFRAATEGYFQAMDIPLRCGRMFTEADRVPVALVNETLAHRFYSNEDAVGKRFTTGYAAPGRPITWIAIVGVVGDIRHKGLNEDADAELFFPYRQTPLEGMTVVVRTAGGSDPARFAPVLRSAVSGIDSQQPVSRVRPMEQVLKDSIAPQRFSMVVLGVFAAIALALAAVGIYGVISFAVTRRTHEIGVRMALGAERGDVLGMVVRHAMLLAGIGIGIGVAGSLALSRVIVNLLYGTRATDLRIFASVAILLAVVAALAGYIPARRAARVEPVVALRYE